ncbi:MAG: hypothetical protein NC337_03555 [Roseburia sp.]|nr:hypothetical protein [Roseburia sp.]
MGKRLKRFLHNAVLENYQGEFPQQRLKFVGLACNGKCHGLYWNRRKEYDRNTKPQFAGDSEMEGFMEGIFIGADMKGVSRQIVKRRLYHIKKQRGEKQ